MTKIQKLNKLFRAKFGANRPDVYQGVEFAQAEIVNALRGVLDRRKNAGMPYSQTIGIHEAIELVEKLF